MSNATEKVRDDWNSQAGGWYKERDALFTASRPIHDWLVRHLAPMRGERVLEIAAGPGDTGFLVAPLLGDGCLVSTDLSPEMNSAARKRGAELGITNADYRVLDAQAMDLPDASFDGAICRWGYMLMPDPAAALRETRRVLVPGGRLVFAVFTAPERNPFASLPARLLIETGHLPAPDPASGWQPGILALADRDRLRSLVDSAGFTSLHIEPVAMTWTFENADAYWRFLVDLTAFGPRVRALPAGEQARLRSMLDERLATFTRGQEIALPSECWGGRAIA